MKKILFGKKDDKLRRDEICQEGWLPIWNVCGAIVVGELIHRKTAAADQRRYDWEPSYIRKVRVCKKTGKIEDISA